MATICDICGEENPDDATHCEACSAPLDGPSIADRVASAKVLVALFVAVLLVIAAIIIAPMLYNESNGGNGGPDSDNDGMPDDWEEENGLDPDDPADRNEDPDGDGLYNHEEYTLGTDPQNPDTDGDGVEDGLDLIPLKDAGIQISIDSIRINDPVDGILDQNINDPAEAFIRVYVDGTLIGELPSGGPAELEIDEDIRLNWSMRVNVSDDRSHIIRFELFDKDTIGEQQIDINKDPDDKQLLVEYHLGNEIGRSYQGSSDGSDDGNDTFWRDEKDAKITYTITTIDMRAP